MGLSCDDCFMTLAQTRIAPIVEPAQCETVPIMTGTAQVFDLKSLRIGLAMVPADELFATSPMAMI
jgi:hypothetical protein